MHYRFVAIRFACILLRICFQKAPSSPTLLLVSKELPKGAVVEKQVLLHTGRCPVVDDGEMTLQKRVPLFEQGHYLKNRKHRKHLLIAFSTGDLTFDDGSIIHWEISKFNESTTSCAVIFLKGGTSNTVIILIFILK